MATREELNQKALELAELLHRLKEPGQANEQLATLETNLYNSMRTKLSEDEINNVVGFIYEVTAAVNASPPYDGKDKEVYFNGINDNFAQVLQGKQQELTDPDRPAPETPQKDSFLWRHKYKIAAAATVLAVAALLAVCVFCPPAAAVIIPGIAMVVTKAAALVGVQLSVSGALFGAAAAANSMVMGAGVAAVSSFATGLAATLAAPALTLQFITAVGIGLGLVAGTMLTAVKAPSALTGAAMGVGAISMGVNAMASEVSTNLSQAKKDTANCVDAALKAVGIRKDPPPPTTTTTNATTNTTTNANTNSPS